MNKNEKFSELLSFASKVAAFSCECQQDDRECISCPAVELLRRVTFKEDTPINTGE